MLQVVFFLRFYQLPAQSPQTPLPPPKRGFSFFSLLLLSGIKLCWKIFVKSRVLLIAPYSPALHFLLVDGTILKKSDALFRLPYRPTANTTLTLTLFASVGLTYGKGIYSIPKSVLCDFLYVIYF